MQYLREAYGEGNLIFIDTDIVCQEDLTDLFVQLASGQCFMHTKEYTLASKRGTAQEMWRQARHRTYGSLTVNEESSMWNSGVVAIPDHLWERCLSAALMCCDEMCERGVKPKIIEQFSLSLALEKEQRLMPADQWFIHYWGNKPPWNALIATFLADVLLKQESVETACERMTTLPLNMPVTIKRTRLERLANSVTKRLRRRDNIVEQTVTEWLTR
jgi:lipopolysaccharide biosynthesis glycosyltransferase